MMLMLLLFSMVLTLTTQTDLKILNTPSGTSGEQSCSLTCVGVAKWDGDGTYHGDGWKDSRTFLGKSYIAVNMGQCDFVSTPVMTLSLISEVAALCPSLCGRELYPDWFSVYTLEKTTAAEMVNNKCNLHWSAFGYTC
jgi:hypothetical protein